MMNYKYKRNRNNAEFTNFEIRRKGVVYKKILFNDKCYAIIKYITKDGDSYKANIIKYKVKIWTGRRYKSLCLCNNPRQAMNYIKDHSNDKWCLYA